MTPRPDPHDPWGRAWGDDAPWNREDPEDEDEEDEEE